MNSEKGSIETERLFGRIPRRPALGCLSVFCSAALFYTCTVIIRWAAIADAAPASSFAFYRLALGFVVVVIALCLKPRSLLPKEKPFLALRVVANTCAMFCLYTAVQATNTAEANILNLASPVYIAFFSWIFFKQSRDIVSALLSVAAFGGVVLILGANPSGFTVNSLWGIASGIFAAFAVIALNQTRQKNDTLVVLFYLFGVGSILLLLIFPGIAHIPDMTAFWYVFSCSACGVGGQFLFTFGMRYVSAVEGGIIASTRMLLAAVLGAVLAGDPPLDFVRGLGVALIFGANAIITYRRFNGRQPAVDREC